MARPVSRAKGKQYMGGTSSRIAIQPSISLRSCYTSYFIHDGKVYPVAGSPSDIFRAAVPTSFTDEVAEKLLQADDVDITARFYILNRLSEFGMPMQLYGSKQEATHFRKKV